MNQELFQIEPTKPTKLEQARRALADAETHLAEVRKTNDAGEVLSAQRAVDRFAELVKEEERRALEISKQQQQH
jgi:hypothetical protein